LKKTRNKAVFIHSRNKANIKNTIKRSADDDSLRV
jgi:hypothetical protein